MTTYRAALLDVFDTVIQVDYTAHALGLADATGLSVERLVASLSELSGPVTDGRLTMSEALAQVLHRSGVEPREEILSEVLDRDHRLLRAHTVVPDDVVPFLELLREREVPTALVSNCAENARSLLDDLGLSALVDDLVMSCEIGSAKPEPVMYETALERLGVSAGDALFVDDQPPFCEGAEQLGIRAVRIARREQGNGAVRSLTELADYF